MRPALQGCRREGGERRETTPAALVGCGTNGNVWWVSLVSLSVERIDVSAQLVALAETLAELQRADQVSAPHYRPVTASQIERFLKLDNRARERAVLVARRGEAVVGWCHVEPPAAARTGGDVYPLVGAEVAFQPGLPHAAPGPEYGEIARALLYAACQVRAQQEAAHVELFAPDGCWAEQVLRGLGFQPADRWGTYVSQLSGGAVGQAPLTVSSLREPELPSFPALLAEHGLIESEFTSDDLARLVATVPGFAPQGLLLARRSGAVAGYAAVMVDREYASATGRERAWLGFGPLGMAVVPSGEQSDWLRTLVQAAAISASARGAQELAFVASTEGKQLSVWGRLDFVVEVRWRRWRTDL
jgi:hypothetical protein